MRITPTKVLNAVVFLTLLSLVLVLYQNSPDFIYSNSGPKFRRTCLMSKSFQRNLETLIHVSHSVLQGLNLVHFLCYGALFGQIRYSATLPWAKKVEICVLNEELIQFDELYLKRAFAKHDLDIVYDSSNGHYLVTVLHNRNELNNHGMHFKPSQDSDGSSVFDPDFNGVLYLIVFALDKDIKSQEELMYHRVGWKRRMLPPDCEYSSTLDCFPERLAQLPLPTKLFGHEIVPVPREEFEIQKYHFPQDWWKEVKSLNC